MNSVRQTLLRVVEAEGTQAWEKERAQQTPVLQLVSLTALGLGTQAEQLSLPKDIY